MKIQMVDLKGQYKKIKQEVDAAIQEVIDSAAFINGPAVKGFAQNLSDYAYWKTEGVMFQLNIPSVAGMYGPFVQHKAEELLKKGMYDCGGTDTHSLDFAEEFIERPLKKQVVKEVRKLITDKR